MNNVRRNHIIYLAFGLLAIPLSMYGNYFYIANGEFPEGIMLFSLGTSSLMMAYLAPHLFPKDERSKEIIGKSMTINYFTLFASITFLIVVIGNTLNATQVLTILFCIMTISIPFTMVIFSKKI